MKACRQNVKVKNLSETGEFNTAYELLQRLRQRYYTVDDITKAKHMLNYHALFSLLSTNIYFTVRADTLQFPLGSPDNSMGITRYMNSVKMWLDRKQGRKYGKVRIILKLIMGCVTV